MLLKIQSWCPKWYHIGFKLNKNAEIETLRIFNFHRWTLNESLITILIRFSLMNTFVTGGWLQAQLWSLKKGRSRIIVLNFNALKRFTAVCSMHKNFLWTVPLLNIKWKSYFETQNMLLKIKCILSFFVCMGDVGRASQIWTSNTFLLLRLIVM